ncbi:hypothetical protein [Salipiger sp.]|uniref:hypothetical protein n=1 Tax=Salipiger sp. TaxID=2078585 RepID=UPI003A98509E
MVWPFRIRTSPRGSDAKIRDAAPLIAEEERRLALLKQRREEMVQSIASALDEISRRPREDT